MKWNKKALAMTIVLLMLAPFTSLTAEDTPLPPLVGSYIKTSGEVTEVLPYINPDGSESADEYYIHIKDADGNPVVLLINLNTCNITGDVPAPGDRLDAWHDATLPAALIFPPRYQAAAFAVNLDGMIVVKVARFDENFLSYDKELIIHVGPDTTILQANGSEFTGGAEALVTRALVVLYSIETMSIPPQTTPEKIFVLYERAVPLPGAATVTPETPEEGIVVNGIQIEAPAVYLKGDVLMVPLRAIAEALDYTVQWDDAARGVFLNNSISLNIGKDYYTYARMVPIELGTAPEIVDGFTFVPLSFFKEVVRMNNAYYFEGRVEINNDEPMA